MHKHFQLGPLNDLYATKQMLGFFPHAKHHKKTLKLRRALIYRRMATVMASGEVAQGQMTSGFRPWDWNTFRKASQEDTDPEKVMLELIRSQLILRDMSDRL